MKIQSIILNKKPFENPFTISSPIQDEKIVFNTGELNDIWSSEYEDGDLFVVDKNVWDLVNTPLGKTFLLEATEDAKTIGHPDSSVMNVLDFVQSFNFTKKNKIIAIGGGITQDICVYVCSLYKRGINWVFIPTTLLAMGDSSVGGKGGINYKNTKNLIALFGGPTKVITNVKFLETLTRRDLNSGIGEIFKLAVIGGEIDQYRSLFKNQDYSGLIKLGLEIKAAIVEYDRFEKGIRKVLNYGHTFGHALEIATNYKIPHGLAVAIGCYLINHLFLNDASYDQDILNLTVGENLDDIDWVKFFSAVSSDKKNMGSSVCFIVCDNGTSEFIYHELTDELKVNVINQCLQLQLDFLKLE